MEIVLLTPLMFDAWVAMRHALWPDYSELDLRGTASGMPIGSA